MLSGNSNVRKERKEFVLLNLWRVALALLLVLAVTACNNAEQSSAQGPSNDDTSKGQSSANESSNGNTVREFTPSERGSDPAMVLQPSSARVAKFQSGNNGAAAPQVEGITVQITEIQQVVRDECTCSSSDWQEHVPGTQITFYPDNTFVFSPPGIGTLVRSDLFPVPGTYQESGEEVQFQGHRESYTSNGNATVEVSGTLRVGSDGTASVDISQRTTASTFAVVNEQEFESHTMSDREYVASVEPIQ